MERIATPFEYAFVRGVIQVQVKGLLRLEPHELVIEFRGSTVDWSTAQSEEGALQELRIPLVDLAGVELKRRWFAGAMLVLRTLSMRALEVLPGAGAGEVRLTIARRNRALAAELAWSLQHALAERHLRELESNPDEAAAFQRWLGELQRGED